MIGKIRRLLLSAFAVAAVAGCTDNKEPPPPTEQEIHAGDSGVASGELGRHPYVCDDGSRLLIDFKDEGLQLVLRDGADAAPITLTAPTQGLQYVGDRISATLAGANLTVQRANGRPRTCQRETAR